MAKYSVIMTFGSIEQANEYMYMNDLVATSIQIAPGGQVVVAVTKEE